MKKTKLFWIQEEGSTAIEYAIIAVLMALMLVILMPSIRSSLSSFYTAISDSFPEESQ